ncbi:MAG TPA: sugar phosphate isomerase/epimerase [Candidatus Dormibacteraeota bacterium]|nr:sugar phosphate isomerase/epimerase [Candidatus Dormibacteraeota bacterium]
MKLAFSTLACPGWSIDEVAEAARQYGYDGIELRLLDGRLIDSSLSTADRDRVRKTFQDAGLPIVALDTSVRVAADPPEPALRELSSLIEIASAWGSPVVRVFGGDWSAGRSPEDAVGQARYVLGEASAVAERVGIAIALETHDCFSGADIVAEVLDGLPGAAAALWDVAHPFRVGDDANKVVQLLGGRIAHVHVKDARRNAASPDGWELTLLGDGEVPVRSCLDALSAAGYDGWISVEWEKHWHPELAEPEVALPQFAAMLRSWRVQS